MAVLQLVSGRDPVCLEPHAVAHFQFPKIELKVLLPMQHPPEGIFLSFPAVDFNSTPTSLALFAQENYIRTNTTHSRIKKVVLELKDNKLVTVQHLGYSASKSFLLRTFEVPYYNNITIFLPNKLQVSIQVKNSHLLKMSTYLVIVSITYCINWSSNSVTVSLNIVTQKLSCEITLQLLLNKRKERNRKSKQLIYTNKYVPKMKKIHKFTTNHVSLICQEAIAVIYNTSFHYPFHSLIPRKYKERYFPESLFKSQNN